jgi:esterase/lipase superfamily enzyme
MLSRKLPIACIILLLTIAGCSSYKAPQPPVPEEKPDSSPTAEAPKDHNTYAAPAPEASDSRSIRRPGQKTERKGFTSERVFFATNRKPSDSPSADSDPDQFFSAARSELRYGWCDVSIPYRRLPGSLPEPSILRLEFSQDPAKHIVLLEINLLPDADFWDQVRTRVEASEDRSLFLFIHGYAATFRDAARRTAQLAWDMNYSGAAMFFSWPAGGPEEGFLEGSNYLKDLRNAAASDYDLLTVLEQISLRSGARKIHVAAHSMGSHLLTESLKRWHDKLTPQSTRPAAFHKLVLAAPDVDAGLFVNKHGRQLAAFHSGLTVYASNSDRALDLSRKVNDYNPLGQINSDSLAGAREKLYDLVDVSTLASNWFDTGHLYYGDLPEMIHDLQLLFRGILAQDPARKLRLESDLFQLNPG